MNRSNNRVSTYDKSTSKIPPSLTLSLSFLEHPPSLNNQSKVSRTPLDLEVTSLCHQWSVCTDNP